MYSFGPLHMAEQKQGDQLEPTYSSSVRIRGVALRTCRKRWTIRRGDEKGSGISVLMARQFDEMIIIIIITITNILLFESLRVSWWFLTGVWMTASLLKSPWLFSVFWSILIMQQLGWSLLVLLFPSPPVPLSILDYTKWIIYNWCYSQFHLSQLFQFSPKVSVLTFLYAFFQFYHVVSMKSFLFFEEPFGAYSRIVNFLPGLCR